MALTTITQLEAQHAERCGYRLNIDPDEDGNGFGYACDICGMAGYAVLQEPEAEADGAELSGEPQR